MGKYFGTDGIRGVANEMLDARFAVRAGNATADALIEDGRNKPRIIIGKDTRISSDMLEAALAAGLCSAGADVTLLGVLPTPAVAYLTVSTGADMGIVISASHNTYEHNGIKMFNSEGFKIADSIEERVEYLIDHPEELKKRTHDGIGRQIHDDEHGTELYIDHLFAAAGCEISGLRIAVDCANGAAVNTARRLFSRFDIDVTFLAGSPDGLNINDDCGSTHIDSLAAEIKKGGYDMGFAFDGDADRCLAVDGEGNVVDGDSIIAICARDMKTAGTLRGGGIVGTILTNTGLTEFAKSEGIVLHAAAVGDRNVLEMMQSLGCNIGGETSGHTIFLDESTTGDGQLSAVKLLSIVARTGKPLSEIAGGIPHYPQVMINIPIAGGNAAMAAILENPDFTAALEVEKTFLSNKGRIIVRPSGTEPLIRVIVEAKRKEIAYERAEKLANVIRKL